MIAIAITPAAYEAIKAARLGMACERRGPELALEEESRRLTPQAGTKKTCRPASSIG